MVDIDDAVHAGEVEHEPTGARNGDARHVVPGDDGRHCQRALVGEAHDGLHLVGCAGSDDEVGFPGRVLGDVGQVVVDGRVDVFGTDDRDESILEVDTIHWATIFDGGHEHDALSVGSLAFGSLTTWS